MTNYRLAKVSGIHASTIANWLNGAKPQPDKLVSVAEALGVTVADLTGEKKEPADGEFLSPEKQQLLSLVDTLSDEQCRRLAGIIEEAKKLL